MPGPKKLSVEQVEQRACLRDYWLEAKSTSTPVGLLIQAKKGPGAHTVPPSLSHTHTWRASVLRGESPLRLLSIFPSKPHRQKMPNVASKPEMNLQMPAITIINSEPSTAKQRHFGAKRKMIPSLEIAAHQENLAEIGGKVKEEGRGGGFKGEKLGRGTCLFPLLTSPRLEIRQRGNLPQIPETSHPTGSLMQEHCKLTLTSNFIEAPIHLASVNQAHEEPNHLKEIKPEESDPRYPLKKSQDAAHSNNSLTHIRSLPDVAMTGNCSQECSELGHSDACWMPGQPSPVRKTRNPPKLSTFVPYQERGSLGRLANGSVRLGGEENRPRLPPSRSAYSSSDHTPSDHAPLEEVPLSVTSEYQPTSPPSNHTSKREIYL
ncbi:hypothetical protein DNTS_025928 [Danionella cerebrum]|uniref:Uncharacterized protein n=1 Tax=Danionella cerebrum TaxID=2873325 RepID=A0A553MX34_9TELE|nr:hypothetical protein DNTS_025928 [Danionella translucida]